MSENTINEVDTLGFLYSLLTDSETNHPKEARTHLINAIHSLVGCKYASIWIHHPETDTLHLGACSGDADLLASAVLQVDTPAGDILHACEDTDYIQIDNVNSDPRYRDKELIDRYQLSEMYSFRLGDRKKPIGTVCIYPKHSMSEQTKSELVKALELAVLFLNLATDRFLIKFEDALNSAFTTKDDVGSYLHKILDIIRSRMSLLGVTLFLWDEKNRVFSVKKTTGLKTNVKETSVRYTIDDPFYTEVQKGIIVIKHGEEAKSIYQRTRVHETGCGNYYTIALVPFKDARNRGKVLGFARFVNEKNYVKQYDANYFSDADTRIFERIAESIALGIHFFNEEAHIDSIFSHFLHESGEAIEGIGAKCERLLNPDRFPRDDVTKSLHIEDVAVYTDGLKSLVEQYSTIGVDLSRIQLEPERCNVITDLITPSIYSATNLVRKEYGLTVSQGATRRIHYGVQFLNQRRSPSYDLRVDRTRIRHVLANLLKNAVKYRVEDPNLFEVEVRVVEREDRLQILVSDTGIGIPEEDRSHIYEKGHRGIVAQTKYLYGTGIGLHLCQGYMEKHGGEIELLDKRSYAKHDVAQRFRTVFLLEFPEACLIRRR